MDLITVKRALLSVSDKAGLPEFAKGLAGAGVELLSTGGTAKLLREHDIPVKDVSEVTGFPECLDGRVKTLHPNIHAGLLADRKNPSHLSQASELGVGLIDLVVVNLYPFDKAAEVPGRTRDDLTEQIDIGGPTMLRAAAKNCDSVAVVCDPGDYGTILESITGSGITKDQSRDLAAKVFHHTAAYDAAISQAMREPRLRALPERWALGLIKESNLRYGENPHQLGAFYRVAGKPAEGLSALKQFQGKGLSYNNYLDMDAAYRLAAAFDDPTAVVVKHQNPCGVGFHDDMAQAFARAFAADTVSAFGGVVALNRPLTAAAAEKMKGIFLEVIVAPEVDPKALEVLGKKKNLRVVQAPPSLP
ncbi:MAG: bifunctional phosphoribosylaminoimidazolecarboxamide formyltransferase/IMP cyclohydrolase, partial [Candidatus Eisenbacteria bacterium]|nr:bifunctional phosphoribosylaminoimidazolecarboxamide formyltransferase/IMP cyclohydrolase [Candidatus Eisenbacteria bacterium]